MCVAMSWVERNTHMQTTKIASGEVLTRWGAATLGLLFSIACSGAAEMSDAEEQSADTSNAAQALRSRRRAPQPQRIAASEVPSSSAGTSSATAATPTYHIDPTTGVLIPAAMDPNVDPNSGVNYNELSNAEVQSGGQCANGRAMSGTCPSYGVQCTYDQDNVTHYCTCLFSNSLGVQGWECR